MGLNSGAVALFILASGFSITTFQGYQEAFDGFTEVPYRCYVMPDTLDESVQHFILQDVRTHLEGVCNYHYILTYNDVEDALTHVVFADPDPPKWVIMLSDKLYPMPTLWLTISYLHSKLEDGTARSAALGSPTATNILPDNKKDYHISSFVMANYTQELPVGFFLTQRHFKTWGLRGGRNILLPVKSRMHNIIDRPANVPYAVHTTLEKGSDGIFTPDRAEIVDYTPA